MSGTSSAVSVSNIENSIKVDVESKCGRLGKKSK